MIMRKYILLLSFVLPFSAGAVSIYPNPYYVGDNLYGICDVIGEPNGIAEYDPDGTWNGGVSFCHGDSPGDYLFHNPSVVGTGYHLVEFSSLPGSLTTYSDALSDPNYATDTAFDVLAVPTPPPSDFRWPNWINDYSPGFASFVARYQAPMVWLAAGVLILSMIKLALLVIRGFNIFTKRYRP